MYFDSHCHLTDDRFSGEAAAAAERARAAGVERFVLIGSDADDSAEALRMASEFGVWSTAGIHPHEARRATDSFSRIEELVTDPGIVAVGETGLDYYYDNSPRREQRRSFERHLDLAARTGKPVVVHCREADEDTIAMIGDASADVTGVLHCFAGGRPLLEAGLEAGWYISFSGLVTFNSYGTPELVKLPPSDRLLVETDSPYLAPVPHRGKRNEPAYVVEVARAVAELRETSPEVVAEQTRQNAIHFYNLKE